MQTSLAETDANPSNAAPTVQNMLELSSRTPRLLETGWQNTELILCVAETYLFSAVHMLISDWHFMLRLATLRDTYCAL